MAMPADVAGYNYLMCASLKARDWLGLELAFLEPFGERWHQIMVVAPRESRRHSNLLTLFL
jgi:hypothetical protein